MGLIRSSRCQQVADNHFRFFWKSTFWDQFFNKLIIEMLGCYSIDMVFIQLSGKF